MRRYLPDFALIVVTVVWGSTFIVNARTIDHEPPIRIETELTRGGITFTQNEQVEIINTRTGQIDLFHVPDEITFEVESFNKRVITQPFNRVVAE